MVRIRCKRLGRRNRPFYRIDVFDGRTRRDGRSIESLGFYDPLAKDEAAQVQVKADRVAYWLSVGAQPSPTVRSLLDRQNVAPTKKVAEAVKRTPEEEKARQLAREEKRSLITAQKARAEAASPRKLSKKEQREAKKAGR